MCACRHVCLRVYVCVCARVCVFVHVYTCVYACMSVYMCVCVCTCMCVCVCVSPPPPPPRHNVTPSAARSPVSHDPSLPEQGITFDIQTHLTVVDVLFGTKQHNCGKVKTKQINHVNSKNVYKYVKKNQKNILPLSIFENQLRLQNV